MKFDTDRIDWDEFRDLLKANKGAWWKRPGNSLESLVEDLLQYSSAYQRPVIEKAEHRTAHDVSDDEVGTLLGVLRPPENADDDTTVVVHAPRVGDILNAIDDETLLLERHTGEAWVPAEGVLLDPSYWEDQDREHMFTWLRVVKQDDQ